jgi:hypothetical protein
MLFVFGKHCCPEEDECMIILHHFLALLSSYSELGHEISFRQVDSMIYQERTLILSSMHARLAVLIIDVHINKTISLFPT